MAPASYDADAAVDALVREEYEIACGKLCVPVVLGILFQILFWSTRQSFVSLKDMEGGPQKDEVVTATALVAFQGVLLACVGVALFIAILVAAATISGRKYRKLCAKPR